MEEGKNGMVGNYPLTASASVHQLSANPLARLHAEEFALVAVSSLMTIAVIQAALGRPSTGSKGKGRME